MSDYFTSALVNADFICGLDGIPQMPMLVYKTINDELTSIGSTDDHIDRICRVGANILYQRNTVGFHADEYVSGGARALKWLDLVLEGKRPEPHLGCRVENVSVGI